MFDASKSLNEVVKQMSDLGAALMRMTGESDNGTPLYAVIVTQGEETTGDVLALLDAYDNDDAAEDEANPVKAMVAGPALLAACEAAAEVIEVALGDNQIHADSDDGREAVRALKALREAIAKATGEPVVTEPEEADADAA